MSPIREDESREFPRRGWGNICSPKASLPRCLRRNENSPTLILGDLTIYESQTSDRGNLNDCTSLPSNLKALQGLGGSLNRDTNPGVLKVVQVKLKDYFSNVSNKLD